MSALQKRLIEKARRAYKRIFPCTSRQSFEECFTTFGTKCLFWFNTSDNSTHMVIAEITKGMDLKASRNGSQKCLF